MPKINLAGVVFLLTLAAPSAYAVSAGQFTAANSYTVCFTPRENCLGTIVKAINQAHSSTSVQAYSFTAAPVAKALVLAKQRGGRC